MRTYIDQSRVSRDTDRKIHAADLEMNGLFVQMVPAIARKLAPRARTWRWAREAEELARTQTELLERQGTTEAHRCQRERWWCEQWAQAEGLYRVRLLTAEQNDEVEWLLSGEEDALPNECFTDAKGPLAEHNDAQIVAQVIVLRGHLIVTSNLDFVDGEALEAWRKRHGNRYGTPPETPLVQNADALYRRWLKDPTGREVIRRSTIGAYWPESPAAKASDVKHAVNESLQALERGGHMSGFAAEMRAIMTNDEDRTDEAIRRVRNTLPMKMRRAERRWIEMYEGIRDRHTSQETTPVVGSWGYDRWP